MNMKVLHFTAFSIVFFYTVKRNVTFQAEIQYNNHTEVFLYLSTVDNLQVLNPTIINITYWEPKNETTFFIEYTEYLSQLPFVTNYAQAFYHISQDEDGSHDLSSQHLTCFFIDLLCLSTDSLLRISQVSEFEVNYQEEIWYSCPWILTKFCFEEVAFQRKLIFNNLKRTFSMQPTEYSS